MEKKLMQIRELLEQGKTFEEILKVVGGDENRLFRNVRENSHLFKDFKFVRRNK